MWQLIGVIELWMCVIGLCKKHGSWPFKKLLLLRLLMVLTTFSLNLSGDIIKSVRFVKKLFHRRPWLLVLAVYVQLRFQVCLQWDLGSKCVLSLLFGVDSTYS